MTVRDQRMPDVGEEERRRVMLLTCLHGHDIDDRRDLLTVLGLITGQPDPDHRIKGAGLRPVLDTTGSVRRCAAGHPLTADNTYWYPKESRQAFRCITCRRYNDKRRRRALPPERQE